ncbi:MAG TPA: glucose-1-phosphate cytidylyltransferase [Vicinamibacterales bacterium]|nr:glucose-1-phosphate cytidylyltransferase [Vicinamibacterales bacterium]
MKTVILAGGFGTRLSEETTVRPKPMVEIGGRPILWHIMRGYAACGFNEFVIALGYKGEMIKEHFLEYHRLQNDLTIHLASGRVDVHDGECEDWTVHLRDTGLLTASGGRLKRLAPVLRDGTFLMTYGDGVAELDINELVAFHRRHGKLATLLAVPPPARFGALSLSRDEVARFEEKPVIGDGWINGGFFVLEPGVLDYVDGDDQPFEREPLERLAKDGQLMAFRHEKFWHCMDTMRDLQHLNALWDSGDAPWTLTWRRQALTRSDGR